MQYVPFSYRTQTHACSYIVNNNARQILNPQSRLHHDHFKNDVIVKLAYRGICQKWKLSSPNIGIL